MRGRVVPGSATSFTFIPPPTSHRRDQSADPRSVLRDEPSAICQEAERLYSAGLLFSKAPLDVVVAAAAAAAVVVVVVIVVIVAFITS